MKRDAGSTRGGQARQKQLVDCAIETLNAVGLWGTSVGAVATRAGVSKGVVTYHFPTKESLFRAVVSALYMRAGDWIEAQVSAAHSPIEAVDRYVAANLEFVATHARHVRAVIEIAAARCNTERRAAARRPRTSPATPE